MAGTDDRSRNGGMVAAAAEIREGRRMSSRILIISRLLLSLSALKMNNFHL